METIQTPEWCLTLNIDWMRANRLKLNPDKIEIMLV